MFMFINVRGGGTNVEKMISPKLHRERDWRNAQYEYISQSIHPPVDCIIL
jgi:hypothetical protein